MEHFELIPALVVLDDNVNARGLAMPGYGQNAHSVAYLTLAHSSFVPGPGRQLPCQESAALMSFDPLVVCAGSLLFLSIK